jgi:hypothetical protein
MIVQLYGLATMATIFLYIRAFYKKCIKRVKREKRVARIETGYYRGHRGRLFQRDIDKGNLAQLNGWRVLRFSALNYKTIIDQLNQIK